MKKGREKERKRRRGKGEEKEKKRRGSGEEEEREEILTNMLPVVMVKVYVLETVPLKVGALRHCLVVQVVQLI